MRRQNENWDVFTEECTSGKDVLTVVETDNLTVVYPHFRPDTRLDTSSADSNHLWWFTASAWGRMRFAKPLNNRCLGVGQEIAFTAPEVSSE